MGGRGLTREVPDLGLLKDVVSDRVLRAMRLASSELTRLGVRHWLVGGLAVGAYGHPRATKAVDFFVGDEAFETLGGGLVTMKHGVPIQADGVAIDHLSAQEGESFLVPLLNPPTEELAVAPLEVLVYLKLKSPRAKDRADVVELIKAGADVQRCKKWLAAHAPAHLPALDALEQTARAEE